MNTTDATNADLASKLPWHRRYAVLAAVLVSVVVLSGLALRYGTSLMLPDNFNYVGYWQQVFEGSFHTTALQTPNPLFVPAFGVLHRMTGGFGFLIVFSVAMGVLAFSASTVLVRSVSGRWGIVASAGFLLLHDSFLSAVLSGASELFSAGVIMWLIARHSPRDQVLLPDWKTGLSLLLVGLMRPENWVLSVGALAATGVYVALRPGEGAPHRRTGAALMWVALPVVLGPLAWLGFDLFAFGDARFSFERASYFADVVKAAAGAPETGAWHGYPLLVFTAIRSQVSASALVWAGIGSLFILAKRPALIVALAVPLAAVLGFYFVAYSIGFIVFQRFVLLAVMIALVAASAGWAEMTDFMLKGKPRWSGALTPEAVEIGRRVVVVSLMAAMLIMPIRGLAGSLAWFDAQKRWRAGILTGADAVRRDRAYGGDTPVVVRMADLTLVGWVLGSDGRNLIDPASWAYRGGRFGPEVSTAYFIVDASAGEYPRALRLQLREDRLPEMQVTPLFDGLEVAVFKATRR